MAEFMKDVDYVLKLECSGKSTGFQQLNIYPEGSFSVTILFALLYNVFYDIAADSV